MKMYSANVVTKEEVQAAAEQAAKSVDAKQTEQIMKLRTAVTVLFIVNLLVAIGGYFF